MHNKSQYEIIDCIKDLKHGISVDSSAQNERQQLVSIIQELEVQVGDSQKQLESALSKIQQLEEIACAKEKKVSKAQKRLKGIVEKLEPSVRFPNGAEAFDFIIEQIQRLQEAASDDRHDLQLEELQEQFELAS